MKKLESLFFLIFLFFIPAFSKSILANQLFWDCDSLYDYATRLGTHPEVPSLPSSSDLQLDLSTKTKYNYIKDIVDELRKTQSETKILVNEVQKQSLRMKKWPYFSGQVILRIFNKGITPLIDSLIQKENKLNGLHSELMNQNFQDFFNSLEESESLSNFAGRVATDTGVTYSDLEITAETLKKTNYVPFFTLVPFEDGCSWSFANSTFTVPEYRIDFLIGQSTPLCNPNKFYSEPQLDIIVNGPDWTELTKRINFLNDLNSYLRTVTKFTNDFETKIFESFDKNKISLERAKNLNEVLNNSQVHLALIEISDSSSLTSSSSTFDFSNVSNEFENINMNLMIVKNSKDIGEKFEILKNVETNLNYFESNFNEAWSLIENKIKIMQELCVSYGESCVYQGALLERLEKTSKTFLSLRLDYMIRLDLNEDAWKIKLSQAESVITEIQTLILDIEDYSKTSKILAYQDKLKTIKTDFNFFKQSKKIFQSELDSFLFKLNDFEEEILNTFVSDNKKKATEIKSELFAIKDLLQKKEISVVVEDKSLSIFSRDIVPNLIYYISNEEYLSQLKQKYSDMLNEYLSNIPSITKCVPLYPILNEDFSVDCVTVINNTWGISFDKANSIINLDFLPNRLSSANFVSDASHLNSVSFSGKGPVRLNLIDVGSTILFEFNYKSHAGTATTDCSVFSDGLNSTITCTILTSCNFEKARVPMKHPFSGKAMTSNFEYTYDGEKIYVEVPCNEYSFVEFKGPTVEIVSNDDGEVTITNLVNSTIDFVSEFSSNETGLEVDSVFGATLLPFEKKEITMKSKLNIVSSDDKIKNETLSVFSLLGYDSLISFADDQLSDLRTKYGCVETNIINEVSKTTKMPRLTCIQLPELEKVKELFDEGLKKEAALKYFEIIEPTKLTVFLLHSAPYKDEAEKLISDARESTKNIVSSSLAGKYLKEAESAYAHKDYITSMYYSKYTLIKSAIPLKFGFRTLLAAGILIYGIYTTKHKEKEELI